MNLMQPSLLLTRKEEQYSKPQDYNTSYPLLLGGLGFGSNCSSIGQVEQGSDNPCHIEDKIDDVKGNGKITRVKAILKWKWKRDSGYKYAQFSW